MSLNSDPYEADIVKARSFNFGKLINEPMFASESRVNEVVDPQPIVVYPEEEAKVKTKKEPVIKKSVTKTVRIVVGVPSKPRTSTEESRSHPSVLKKETEKKPKVFIAQELEGHETPNFDVWRPIVPSRHPATTTNKIMSANEVDDGDETGKLSRLLVSDPYHGKEHEDLIRDVENYEPKVIPDVIGVPETVTTTAQYDNNEVFVYNDHDNNDYFPPYRLDDGDFDFPSEKPVIYKADRLKPTFYVNPFLSSINTIDRNDAELDSLSAPGPPYPRTPLPEHATIVSAPKPSTEKPRKEIAQRLPQSFFRLQIPAIRDHDFPSVIRHLSDFDDVDHRDRSARGISLQAAVTDYGAATGGNGAFGWYASHPNSLH